MTDGVIRLADAMGPRIVQFYALEDDFGCVLFDAALPGSVQSRLASGKLPAPVTRVIISHADADHLGDAGSLREAEILCHALDRDWISNHGRLIAERYGPAYPPESLRALRDACGSDFPVSRTLEDREILPIGRHAWRVLHVPGHTRGHIALSREDDGALLIGDAVLGLAVPDRDGRPSIPPAHCHIAEYLATIERLSGIPVSTVFSGHWPPLDAGEFRSLLADSKTCVLRDLECVVSCSGEPLDVDGYVEQICSRFRSWPPAEDIHYRFAVTGYLEYLTAQSVLQQLPGGRYTAARGVAHV